ncbi:MAG: helix-turn-helix domain-containing protein [Planctomycetes bacterium]|nr:helix-turn-helix domain-containing protein [Planctomycetota bacterium]
MEITIREAADLTGRSARAIRDQIAAGRLPARKQGHGWRVRVEHLPLTDAQRGHARARAQQAHAIIDELSPSRGTTTRDTRRRSVADLDAFRVARESVDLLRHWAAALTAPHALTEVLHLADAAIGDLGEGIHEFDRQARSARFARARCDLARAVALLHVCGATDEPPAFRAAERIEQEVLPLVGGLLRWTARGGDRR